MAYVYELEGDAWTLRQELLSSEPGEREYFGGGLSVEGDTMLVGHAKDDSITFRSHLFTRGGDGVWREAAVLRPGDVPPPAMPFGFGYTSAIHGRWAIIGAHNESPTGVPYYGRGGAAYVFDLDCLMSRCEAGLDADGAFTIFDFLAFANLFDAGNPQADFDGDGELTILDFLAFQTAFDAGCE